MGTALQAVEAEFAEVYTAGVERVVEDGAGILSFRSLVAFVGVAQGRTDVWVGAHGYRGGERVNRSQVSQGAKVAAPGLVLIYHRKQYGRRHE